MSKFLTSAAKLTQCPNLPGREVAVIGRSNVGKSSLLGTLLEQDSLVRRSRTPGRTQLINFFEDNRGQRLVDLPGYGFAKVPAKAKPQLTFMVQEYLSQREQLQIVLLLIDARRAEASPDDKVHFDFAQSHGKRVVVVVTKMDRVPKAKRKPVLRAVEKSLNIAEALPFSSVTGEGKEALWALLQP